MLLQILYVCLFVVYNVKNDKVVVNPFVPNAPFLYPLKTSENFFWCFQGVDKGCIGNEWVNHVFLSKPQIQKYDLIISDTVI